MLGRHALPRGKARHSHSCSKSLEVPPPGLLGLCPSGLQPLLAPPHWGFACPPCHFPRPDSADFLEPEAPLDDTLPRETPPTHTRPRDPHSPRDPCPALAADLEHVVQRQVAEALAGDGQGACGLLHLVRPVPRGLGVPHQGQLQVLSHFVELLLSLFELTHIPVDGRRRSGVPGGWTWGLSPPRNALPWLPATLRAPGRPPSLAFLLTLLQHRLRLP